MNWNLTLFKTTTHALFTALSKVLTALSLMTLTLSFFCGSFSLAAENKVAPVGCIASPRPGAEYLCKNDIVYIKTNNTSGRMTDPYKVVKATSALSITILDLQTGREYEEDISSLSAPRGCSAFGFCFGDLVTVENRPGTYRVVGKLGDNYHFAVAFCTDSSCNVTQGSSIVLSREPKQLKRTTTVEVKNNSRIDQSVITDIQNEFRGFDNISMTQYLALKKQKNPQLLNAQRMVHQLLQSSLIEMLPPPIRATEEELEEAFLTRQQVFNSPVIIQTGLEIIANELLKTEDLQCKTIVNAIRFISVAADPSGNQTPGLDYVRNQLLIMHLTAAYVNKQAKGSLPCQNEINDATILDPSLKNRYRPGCGPNSYSPDCDMSRGKFWDAETRMGVMVLGRAFGQPYYSFNGGGGPFRDGIFNQTKGYSANYSTATLFDAPGVSKRRAVGIDFYYTRPRLRGHILDSIVVFKSIRTDEDPNANSGWQTLGPSAPDGVRKSELPEMDSQSVMVLFKNLAQDFLN